MFFRSSDDYAPLTRQQAHRGAGTQQSPASSGEDWLGTPNRTTNFSDVVRQGVRILSGHVFSEVAFFAERKAPDPERMCPAIIGASSRR